MRVHEDTRLEIGPARPLADLRHVMCECQGTEGRSRRVEGLIVALDGLVQAVPRRVDTQAYHRVTDAARAALAASDQAALTEPQWQHVDDVLAAFVPDFARAEGVEGQRREMIDEVVEALLVVHGRAASLVQSWTQKHRYELERRLQQERRRGLTRVVVRAWREEVDGRKARSLRVAVPKGRLVEAGRHADRLGSGDCLSTEHVPWWPPPRDMKAALQAPDNEALLERLRNQRRGHEGRGVWGVAACGAVCRACELDGAAAPNVCAAGGGRQIATAQAESGTVAATVAERDAERLGSGHDERRWWQQGGDERRDERQ